MSAPLVWLASYPRSGNTWFRILIANTAAVWEGPVDINHLETAGEIASSRSLFDDQTLLDSGLLTQEEADAMRPAVYRSVAAEEASGTRFFKVHDAYTWNAANEPLLGGIGRGAIYIARDPRDVAVSAARYFSRSIDQAIAGMNNIDTVLSMSRKSQALQLGQKLLGWSGHVRSWLDQHEVPVHLVRYEDLMSDTAVIFEAALRFIGETAAPDRIEKAVRHSSFEELRRQERAKGFRERFYAAPFFRQGGVARWREVLTAAQADRIVEDHHETMARLGYLQETKPYVYPQVVGEGRANNPPKD